MGLFDKILGGGLKSLADGAVDVIRSINAPKEEKIKAEQAIEELRVKHEEFVLSQANEKEKAILADIQDARGANAKVQDSANASWMAKNVAYVIDIFVTSVWGGLTSYLIVVMLNLVKKDANVDYTAVTAVWGAVTGVFTQVLSFHRGSSRGSEEKQKTLDKMMSK
jgi:hypothetical protein